jgi:hypothetical protein
MATFRPLACCKARHADVGHHLHCLSANVTVNGIDVAVHIPRQKEYFRLLLQSRQIFAFLVVSVEAAEEQQQLLRPPMSKRHLSSRMSLKHPHRTLLLPFVFLVLFPGNVIAESTFYSVNILKTWFSSTPHAHMKFPGANPMSPEAVLPAFDPISCACGSNGLVDGSRMCNPPPFPPL